METLLVFVVFLGPLIFFHELGHFFFARLCGVRVETFSIGFGKKLFKFKKGDTEYAISMIPLGGYVKMFGDDPMGKDEIPEDQRKFAFTHKNKWQRFWIVFGGPLANFVMAYTIYFFLLIGGETVPQVKLGVVAPEHPFHAIGVQTGDVLTKVNEVNITSLEDLNIGDEAVKNIEVQRAGSVVGLNSDMKTKDFIDNLISINPFLRFPAVIDALSGEKYVISTSKTFDPHVSLDEILLSKAPSIFLIKAKQKGLEYFPEGEVVDEISTNGNLYGVLKSKNLYSIDLLVEGIVDDSPASKAGVAKDDILVGINGKDIQSFYQLRDVIQKKSKNNESVSLSYLHKGQLVQKDFKAQKKEHNGTVYYAIGVKSSALMVKQKMVESKSKGFVQSFKQAYTKTVQGTYGVLMGFKNLIFGSASLKNLGGPIAIAKQASYSLDISLSYFFKMMAIISINLAVLNLLPIPVLDGGHIFFIFYEIITRGPVPRRLMLVTQQIGLWVLLLLMVYAITNDISQLFRS